MRMCSKEIRFVVGLSLLSRVLQNQFKPDGRSPELEGRDYVGS